MYCGFELRCLRAIHVGISLAGVTVMELPKAKHTSAASLGVVVLVLLGYRVVCLRDVALIRTNCRW